MTDPNVEYLVEIAEQLAGRFEKIGLDGNRKMEFDDKILLNRIRRAIEQYRGKS